MGNKVFFFVLSFAFMAMSCMDDTWMQSDDFTFENAGVYIVNSGNFGSSNASLSYYAIDQKQVYNQVISRANGLDYWGDVAQSMLIQDGVAYLVLNNSGKVLLLDPETARITGKITGLTSPRYMLPINAQKAYVSDLYARAISVVDPSQIPMTGKDSASLSAPVHLGQISTNNHQAFFQHSTEQMIAWGSYVFVACWMRDNYILVIDSERDVLIDSLQVAAQPNSLVMDKNNQLWVLCDGGYQDNPFAYEKPKLLRIDPVHLTIEDALSFDLDANPQNLTINRTKDTLYFLDTHLYRMPIDAMQAERLVESHSPHSGYGRGFYGLAIDPYRSEIYISDAVDNNQPGYVYRFDAQGRGLDTFKVGINPVAFCFNPIND